MSGAPTGATLLLFAVAFIGGCGGTEKQEASVPPKSYAMRGMVRQMSEPDVEERQIWIHHEAVDDFVDIRGDTVPMDAMTMPFHLAESVDLTGVDPGDKVGFRLDVDWKRRRTGAHRPSGGSAGRDPTQLRRKFHRRASGARRPLTASAGRQSSP